MNLSPIRGRGECRMPRGPAILRSHPETLTGIQPSCALAVLAMLPPTLSQGGMDAHQLDLARGEGQADALAEILRVMTPPTMAEPGVKLFLSYRSPVNPLLFFVFELYVNEAAWGAHEATDHFKTAVAQLLPTVTRRERVPFIPFLAN
jgi:quinol monooxygenase YgiN